MGRSGPNRALVVAAAVAAVIRKPFPRAGLRESGKPLARIARESSCNMLVRRMWPMTGLVRTDLSTSRKVELAVSALGRQGEHGTVSVLSRAFGVARGTVYSARKTAGEVLEVHFGAVPVAQVAPETSAELVVRVDDAQIRRAIAALRIVVPGTLRPIQELLPVLYPGLRLSYGTVQAIAVDAEDKAAVFNAQVDLSGLTAGALDEMFSQRQPVLGGIGLGCGYAFCLHLRGSRSAEDWAEVLRAGQAQGLDLDVVLKDAAQGIAAGVREVFPEAEQRDDCFHVKFKIGKVQWRLERRALAAIVREEDARLGLAKAREQGQPVQKWTSKLWWAKGKCATAIDLHDAFERAAKQVWEAMEFVDLSTGRIRSATQAGEMLRQAASAMRALPDTKAAKVGRYLDNRIPGLLHAMQDLEVQLRRLATAFGEEPASLACLVVRLMRNLDQPRHRWQRFTLQRNLLAAFGLLHTLVPDRADGLIRAVEHFVRLRYRASSAIEGLNAALRPFLYLHRGVSQGFLELFRAYFNLRTRRSGPYKGMSAYERLMGVSVNDWLTLIGLPPSSALN